MKVNMKKVAKFTGAACAATGVVVLSSLVASGAAIGAVVEGFKSAADTMRKMLAEEPKADQPQAAQAQAQEPQAEQVQKTEVEEPQAEQAQKTEVEEPQAEQAQKTEVGEPLAEQVPSVRAEQPEIGEFQAEQNTAPAELVAEVSAVEPNAEKENQENVTN